jgi:hypothetical protein
MEVQKTQWPKEQAKNRQTMIYKTLHGSTENTMAKRTSEKQTNNDLQNTTWKYRKHNGQKNKRKTDKQ